MRFPKQLLFSFLLIVFSLTTLVGGEGMWLPLLLKGLKEAEMQSMGMKMRAEDIYSVNQGSLKDAIVHFGGFCTAEVISDQGLLLTNHHCGYGQIQSHSSVDKNYLKDGFWAFSKEEELPNPGLTATFIVRIEDITKSVLNGVDLGMDATKRQSLIDKNIEKVKKKVKLEADEEVVIKPFYKGNQYFMFVTLTYKDVRLVGTPPESIGKFGADTDNWVWPRHTGDFSLFRIYAGKNNRPADYSPDNVPMKPKHFLPVSLDGVEEGDFTLVFGFPGRTNQYLPAVAVDQIANVLNPVRIGMRDKALNIMDAAMRADEATKIQYASKFARIANGWKKWIGESQGIKQTKAVEKKNRLENKFQTKVMSNKTWNKYYGTILKAFSKKYRAINSYAITRDYYSEYAFRNVELLSLMSRLRRVVNAYENEGAEGYEKEKDNFLKYADGFFKNYRADLDQDVFAALTELFVSGVKIIETAYPIKEEMSTLKADSYTAYAEMLYAQSAFTDNEKVRRLFSGSMDEAVKMILADPAFALSSKLKKAFDEHVATTYNEVNAEIESLQRLYMKGLMDVFPNRSFYPDANSTMRVTYGKVAGYTPRDALEYHPQTYLSGVMEKYVPGDYEFDVDQKLQDLYRKKDYGPYGQNGKMPVCFIGSNHTTGGNSGSPAIDAHGNLIGLNFDRVWEGTMSDINYDSSICRNIMVDARYILFIIDKYAGASHLIQEMKLVHPKQQKTGARLR